MNPDHLLETATDLVEINTRRPRRADLCRAVSTVYYAMFHCLARICADSLATNAGNRLMWRQVYRALDHRQAKDRCKSMPRFLPRAMREFGQLFADRQSKRHVADYDPDHSFSKSDVVADIDEAKRAIARLRRAPSKHRRDFAIHVLMKVRP